MRTAFVLGLVLAAIVGCSAADSSPQSVNEPTPTAKNVTVCAYPEGPYGFGVGKVLPDGLTWSGLGAGGQPVTYHSSDFLDCDGTKGINAILFDSSAEWCTACQQEARELEGIIKTNWGPNGVAVITLMVEDNAHNPSNDVNIANKWMKNFGLSNVPVVMDPEFNFVTGMSGTIGLPFNVLVNPRDMKILKTQYNLGTGGHEATIDALIAANKIQ
jgi:thiol-disulfide isomerase/thioredoxin